MAPKADTRWAMVGAGAALVGTCYGLARFAYGLFAPEFGAEFAITPTVAIVWTCWAPPASSARSAVTSSDEPASAGPGSF